MFASNHALSGALIGLIVVNPLVALPLAFVSHFVLDAIPHYGRTDDAAWLKNPCFHRLLIGEFLVCVGIVLLLFITQPANWQLASICAFLATSPDLFWMKKFIRGNKQSASPTKKEHWFLQFHAFVQWYEKPNGLYIELPIFVLLMALFGYKIF